MQIDAMTRTNPPHRKDDNTSTASSKLRETPDTHTDDGKAPSPTDLERGRPDHDTHGLQTMRSHHSRAGGDGYTCFDEPAAYHRSHAGQVVREQAHLVGWDGEADPENPRSMTGVRRWGIVLICSASSLCV